MCDCHPPLYVCDTHLRQRIEELVVRAAFLYGQADTLVSMANAFEEELRDRVVVRAKDKLN